MAVFSAVPFFKVVERYPLNGEQRLYKRRDLRRGACSGSMMKHVSLWQPDGRSAPSHLTISQSSCQRSGRRGMVVLSTPLRCCRHMRCWFRGGRCAPQGL